MPQRESDSSRKCHHYSDTLLVIENGKVESYRTKLKVSFKYENQD
jgi:flavin-binding protein dodecin